MADWGATVRSALSLFFVPEIRIWRGQTPLGAVFWGHGVAASSAIVALYIAAVDLEHIILQQALLILASVYTVWILVGIWRCAPNAAPFWGNLARWLTVSWALNSVFVIMFLQFDLLVRYARG